MYLIYRACKIAKLHNKGTTLLDTLLNTFMGTESFCGFKAQPQAGQIYIYGKEGKLKLVSACQYGYCTMEQDVNTVRTGADSKTQWTPGNGHKIHFSTIIGLAITYFVIRWTLKISLKATVEVGGKGIEFTGPSYGEKAM